MRTNLLRSPMHFYRTLVVEVWTSDFTQTRSHTRTCPWDHVGGFLCTTLQLHAVHTRSPSHLSNTHAVVPFFLRPFRKVAELLLTMPHAARVNPRATRERITCCFPDRGFPARRRCFRAGHVCGCYVPSSSPFFSFLPSLCWISLPFFFLWQRMELRSFTKQQRSNPCKCTDVNCERVC